MFRCMNVNVTFVGQLVRGYFDHHRRFIRFYRRTVGERNGRGALYLDMDDVMHP